MVAAKTIFWEVDVQVDFMLPRGKLYVPGAEEIIPNVNRLVEAARNGRVFLISSADAHNADDIELQDWPPHCMKGSPGAELLPEACAPRRLVIPNQAGFAIPEDLSAVQQVILQKNTLDVFANPHVNSLLGQLNAKSSPEIVVFGVATEYCVCCAADGLLRNGRRVAIVTDAIKALDKGKGQEVLNELESRGARLVSAEEALVRVNISSNATA